MKVIIFKLNMWPLIVGVGVVSILSKLFSDNSPSTQKKRSNKKRVFISFAIEDKEYRDFLVLQSKKPNSPFTFIDMSVKKPWTENVWKAKCRTKIKKCDGIIVLISKNTWHSSGTRWEVKCAKEEKIPIIGMQVKKNNLGAKLPELGDSEVFFWTWPNLHSIIDKF